MDRKGGGDGNVEYLDHWLYGVRVLAVQVVEVPGYQGPSGGDKGQQEGLPREKGGVVRKKGKT